MKKYLLAIDPGTTESGVCFMDTGTYKPIAFGKIPNDDVFTFLQGIPCSSKDTDVVIEMVASYGMPVGKEVFETCVWIGRYLQFFASLGCDVDRIYRQDEKLCICKSPKANDATIRQALIDRFAVHDLKNGKGTKKDPDFFYGFAKDVWAAFAVGYTWIEKSNGRL